MPATCGDAIADNSRRGFYWNTWMMTQPPWRTTLLSASLLITLWLVFSFRTFSPQALSVFPEAAAADNGESKQICVIEDPALLESSGIAASRRQEDAFWIHNDSGDMAKLFLVGVDGRTKAIISVKDVHPMDWEDLCSFEMDDEKWLLVGDIGDNGRVRGKSAPACRLLLLKEPKLDVPAATNAQPLQRVVDVVSATEFSFPGGPHDCESLAVDTTRGEILLLTKTDPLSCRLFRLPLTLKPGEHRAQAESIATLSIPWATAMDVSADGRRLVAVNMFSGALVERAVSESWSDACEHSVTVLTLPPRRQGETVCFEPDGQSLLLNSEGPEQPLWRVRLPVAAASTR